MNKALLQNQQDPNFRSYGSSYIDISPVLNNPSNSEFLKAGSTVNCEELEDRSSIEDPRDELRHPFSMPMAWTPDFLLSVLQHSIFSRGLVIVTALSPSFITTRFTGKDVLHKRLYSTSYLDGIRGVACFVVFCCHARLQWFLDDMSLWVETIPFLGMLLQGSSAVSIFFVASGFSISYKPIKEARNGRIAAFGESMSSSFFRRHMRLYLPIASTTFCWAIASYLGWMEGSFDYGGGVPRFPTLWLQLCDWSSDFIRFSNPLRPVDYTNPWEFGTIYDLVTWTIPFEFRGSMIVFILVSALAKLSGFSRAIVIGMLSFACLYTGYWDVCLFLAGTVLCEIHLMRAEQLHQIQHDSLPQNTTPKRYWAKLGARVLTLASVVGFVVGWLFMSIPSAEDWYDDMAAGPYFAFIIHWTPDFYKSQPLCFRFWPAVGAIVFMTGLEGVKSLQVLFTNNFCQYLGKISYSLYLLHYPFLRVPGWYISKRLIPLFGHDIGATFSFVIVIFMVVWAADVFATLVDEKIVKFATWFYGKTAKNE